MPDSGNAVSVVPAVPTAPVRDERKNRSKKFGKIVGKKCWENRFEKSGSNCKLVLLKMIHCGMMWSERI